MANKKSEFIAMEAVIPFLEVTTNQKYLVQRLRGCLISINNDKLIVILWSDLAKGGCIGKFIWNSGGSYGYKLWSEELVTDSAVSRNKT